MKYLYLTFLFILCLCSTAWGANTWTTDVTQDGAGGTCEDGGECSIAEFNNLSGDYSGSTFNFSGTITTGIVIGVYGTSGSPVVLDGDGGASQCTIDTDLMYCYQKAIDTNSNDYITIRDFNIKDAGTGIYIKYGSHDINVYANTIYDCQCKAIHCEEGSLASPYNILIGGSSANGNTVYDCGYGTADADILMGIGCHDYEISYNHLYGSGDTVLRGIGGIWNTTCYNFLIQYNTIHGHTDLEGADKAEGGISVKLACHDGIVRFNRIYNENKTTGQCGIYISGNWDDIYIYGNLIYDVQVGIHPNDSYNDHDGYADGIQPGDIHIWGNILYDCYDYGILVGYASSADHIENAYIYNNTIVSCGDDSVKGSSNWLYKIGTGITVYGSDNTVIKNNILSANSQGSVESYFQMFCIYDSVSGVTATYNRGYYDGSNEPTVNFQSSSSDYTCESFDSVGSNNVEGIPGFENSGSHDYTLTGSSGCRNSGVDLSGLAGSVTVNGTQHDMYYDDCLDGSYTDWSTTPPTVITIKQDDNSSWERGAYIYYEGGAANTPPNGSIDITADNTPAEVGDTILFEGSYTDDDGDTCTYQWTFEADLVDAWADATEYDAEPTVSGEVSLVLDGGTYYKCIQDHTSETGVIETDDTDYWLPDADTQATPGRCSSSTAGIYSVSLTVNDGTDDDLTPANQTITVIDPDTPTTEETWGQNTTDDYNTDGITYINQNSGACSGSPTTSQTVQDAYDARIGYYTNQYFWGAVVTKSGGYTNVCQIDVMLTKTAGDISAKTFYLEVFDRDGDELDCTDNDCSDDAKATAVTQGNNSWSGSTVSFEFDPAINNISQGQVITISMHENNQTNYAGLHYDDTTNVATDITGLSGYGLTGTVGNQYDDDDWYIKIYEQSSTLANTNYGDGANVYCKKISEGGDDNQKIVYLVDLSDIADQTVTSAKFEMYLETAPSSNINVECWSGADAATEAGATWNCAQDDNNDGSCDTEWTGTHGQTTFLDEVAFTSGSSTGQYYEWSSEDLTSYIASKAGSTAYLIFYSDTNDTSAISFSSDDDTDGQRPVLTIEYGGQEDSTVPEVTGITCSTADGEYNDGDSIGPFQVTFSEPVNVTGTPQLVLELGTNDVTCDYLSGSGTAQLTFDAFTVDSSLSHTSARLDAIAIFMNGGTIVAADDGEPVADANEDDILDTFPTGATVGSLAYNTDIVIDTTPPEGNSVNNTDSHASPDGNYTVPEALITWALVTTETGLKINAQPGYPRIAMNVVYPETVYSYAIGLGDTTGTIIFGFVTKDGMRIDDLNLSGAIDVGPGGSITDGSGNAISTDMGALTLAGVAEIDLAVPYPDDNRFSFTEPNDMKAEQDGGFYFVPGDHAELGDNVTCDWDISGAGTSSAPVRFYGHGFTMTGTMIVDEDYWEIDSLNVIGSVTITSDHNIWK